MMGTNLVTVFAPSTGVLPLASVRLEYPRSKALKHGMKIYSQASMAKDGDSVDALILW
jgi:hypothetical protein